MEKIIELYKSGVSYRDIAKECNCSEYKIWNQIKKHNIPLRGSGKSKPPKSNPFLNISKEGLYWLGYIMADGTIIYNNRQYSLVLYSKNKEILEKYNSFMNNQCNIQIWNKQNVYGAKICSKSICKFLIDNYNITPNKSLTLNPNIEISWDLLRGYFDGDGSIRLQQTRCETKFTTGSMIWANRISEFLLKNDIFNVITNKGNAFDVNIYRKSESKKLYQNLYRDANIYLEYKYNRFVALFSNK